MQKQVHNTNHDRLQQAIEMGDPPLAKLEQFADAHLPFFTKLFGRRILGSVAGVEGWEVGSTLALRCTI
jgi:hypothetical protein